MKAVALILGIVFGLWFTAAYGDADDEPPDTTLICPTDNPHCEEPWTQRPPVP